MMLVDRITRAKMTVPIRKTELRDAGLSKKRQSFLVAIDSARKAETILRRAFDLASLHDAHITVLHVINDDVATSDNLKAKMVKAARNYLLQQSRRNIELLVSSVGTKYSLFDIRSEIGDVKSTIASVSNDVGAKLILIGLNDRPSFTTRIIGSTTDYIIRSARAPVLVVKRPCTGRYRRIVAAVDFSTQAEKAAIEAAALCPNASLSLVHILDDSLNIDMALLKTGAGQRSIRDFHRARLLHARQELSKLAKKIDGDESRVTTNAVEGNPRATLVNISRNRHSDLVSIGARRCGPVALQSILGGVALTLLREAACDLLFFGSRATRKSQHQ